MHEDRLALENHGHRSITRIVQPVTVYVGQSHDALSLQRSVRPSPLVQPLAGTSRFSAQVLIMSFAASYQHGTDSCAEPPGAQSTRAKASSAGRHSRIKGIKGSKQQLAQAGSDRADSLATPSAWGQLFSL